MQLGLGLVYEILPNAYNFFILIGAQFDVMRVLDNVPLLSSLNKNQKATLSKKLGKEIFKKNERLMVEGEKGDKFYIIVQVSVKILAVLFFLCVFVYKTTKNTQKTSTICGIKIGKS